MVARIPWQSVARLLRSSLIALVAVALCPANASAFFCNQSNVNLLWGKSGPYQIDGDGFSRGNFRVINPGDESIVSINTMEINDALEAQFEFKGLKPGTTQIEVAWEFTDKSDNGVCMVDVEVSDFPFDMDAARQTFSEFVGGLKLDPNQSSAFMKYNPFCAGARFQTFDPEELDIIVENDVWFGYVDFESSLKYAHPGMFVFIDANTGDLEQFDVNWPPVIDGEDYLGGLDIFTTEDRVFGNPPQVTFEETIETVNDPVSSTPKEEICAVLVSGTATHPRQIEAFETDVDFMKKNLMGESLGPQLAESDISVMNNATFEEIKDKLESFRGAYSKVYFYYSGHGTERYMVTNDTVGNRMWYTDLANALDDTEADDICVIIDACHSGGAVETFRNHEGLQSANVTLLTSSARDTSAWTRYIITGAGDTVRTAEYTWAFVQCFGDPDANLDRVPEITFSEAHRWVRSQNPTLDVGGTINERMDPQMYQHSAAPTTERVVEPRNSGLTVDQGEEDRFPPGSELRVDYQFGTGDTASSDPEIFYISPRVQWDLSLEPEISSGYKINIQFDYQFVEEEFSGLGEPGVVWRPDVVSEWEALRPTIIDSDNKFVTAIDIDKLGHFALAEVEQDETSVADMSERDGFMLRQNAPNPFAENTSIRYTLARPGAAHVDIFDAAGRLVRVLDAGTRAEGDHQLTWDGRNTSGAELPTGAYVARLTIAAASSEPIVLTHTMTLVRR